MADLSMVGIGRPENDYWFKSDYGLIPKGQVLTGLSEAAARAFEREEQQLKLKAESQAAIDKTKQQIQSKNTSSQVANTLNGLTVNMPQNDGTTTQEPVGPSNLEQLQRMNIQRAGTAPMSVLRQDSQDPNIRQTAQNLAETSRNAQMSNEDIYSDNQLTDKYSEVPEVQNYLKNERGRGLNKNISDVASNLSSGKYGQQGQEGFNVTQLTGDFTKALAESGISDEAINSIQDIIKNETKKSTGLGFTTQQKREDWNKIAAMPDGPEKDKAIDDYMMIYAPGTQFPLTPEGIKRAGNKTYATTLAGELGGAAGETESNTNAIPGFKPIPGIKITNDSVKKVKDAAPLINNMNSIVDTILSDIKSKGSVFTGDDAAKYNANVRYLQMLAKSEPVFNLGVITGPDLMLLEQIIPDPSSLKQGMKSTVLGSVQKRLGEFKTNLNNGANEKYKANGFEKEGKKKPSGTTKPDINKTSPSEALGNVSQEKINLAKEALSDPNAPPAVKAQARLVLRNAGVQ